jgi:hypothetical protein
MILFDHFQTCDQLPMMVLFLINPTLLSYTNVDICVQGHIKLSHTYKEYYSTNEHRLISVNI